MTLSRYRISLNFGGEAFLESKNFLVHGIGPTFVALLTK